MTPWFNQWIENCVGKIERRRYIKLAVQAALAAATFGSLYLCFRNEEVAMAFMIAVLIHEYGHALAMKTFGISPVSIFFLPFFGAATIGVIPFKEYGLKRLIISAAGPLLGFTGALGFNALSAIFPQYPFITLLCLASFMANAFSLLPISVKMDGGRIISHIFRTDRNPFRINYLLSFFLLLYTMGTIAVLALLGKALFSVIVDFYQ